MCALAGKTNGEAYTHTAHAHALDVFSLACVNSPFLHNWRMRRPCMLRSPRSLFAQAIFAPFCGLTMRVRCGAMLSDDDIGSSLEEPEAALAVGAEHRHAYLQCPWPRFGMRCLTKYRCLFHWSISLDLCTFAFCQSRTRTWQSRRLHKMLGPNAPRRRGVAHVRACTELRHKGVAHFMCTAWHGSCPLRMSVILDRLHSPPTRTLRQAQPRCVITCQVIAACATLEIVEVERSQERRRLRRKKTQPERVKFVVAS